MNSINANSTTVDNNQADNHMNDINYTAINRLALMWNSEHQLGDVDVDVDVHVAHVDSLLLGHHNGASGLLAPSVASYCCCSQWSSWRQDNAVQITE